MYRSIYPYTSKDPGLLSFENGDVFNLIEQVDGHWWSVHNEKGNHGLVPANYLEVNNVNEEEVLRSLDKCIESISKLSVRGKNSLNEEQRRILQKLIKNRQMVAAGNSLWSKQAASPLTSLTGGIPQQPKRRAPQAPGKSSTKKANAPQPPGDDPIPRSKSTGHVNSSIRRTQTTDDGASSKIYNIVVNNGDTCLPQNNKYSPSNTKPRAKKSVSAEGFRLFIERSSDSSTNSDKDSIGSASPLSPKNGIKEICGKNLTISKSTNTTNNIVAGLQATNFTVSKSGNNTREPNNSETTQTSSINASQVQKSEMTKPKKNLLKRNEAISEHSSHTSLSDKSPSSALSSQQTHTMEASSNSSSIDVKDRLGTDLVDIVRSSCKLSYNKSLAAVRIVLHTLGTEVPHIKEVIDKISEQIVDDKLVLHRGSVANEDGLRLQDILNRLTEHKEDSQQRNWAVHEDFDVIKELLDSLIQTLGEIDPNISRSVLREDEYRYINDLIVYFQMEHRSELRITLLHAFGCICELGAEFVTQLLCSVLPTELALDIMQDQKDILKLLTCCLVLTMVFSTGESVPYNHYVQFNEAFVNFVLDAIEQPPEEDEQDQVADALVGVLLAFNQHLKSPRNNVVLQCIGKRKIFRTLSEKILLLVNRETDPVAMFDFVHNCPDSVMKFLIDLFSSEKTSGIFFTNDLMVLIDIILRQITDRPVKDKTRTEYLSLFHSLLNTTNYSEHAHHADHFKRCFQDILMNRELESEVDLYIVREITNRFSDLFLPS